MRFAVVGDPIAHSKSPALHAAAYRALGMAHTYEARRTTTAELPALIEELRRGALDGCNVTVPHKQRVLEWVDQVDAIAARIGAANTLYRRGAQVIATNTDAPALVAELRERCPRIERAIVLGAGGAARAAIDALATLHAQYIHIRARALGTPRGDAWLASLRPPHTTALYPAPFAADPAIEREVDVVVQATDLGMQREGAAGQGAIAADAIAWSALPAHAVALDLVYAPRTTPFLEAAARRGLCAYNGLGMLARQGALAFEVWLGVRAPLYTMWATLS